MSACVFCVGGGGGLCVMVMVVMAAVRREGGEGVEGRAGERRCGD